MKRYVLYTFSVICCLIFLVACGGGTTPPASATINGVTNLDRLNGKAQLSVSALDANDKVIASGTISNVVATVDQDGVAVNGSVCGNVSSKGSLTSVLTIDASGSMSSNDPDNKRALAAEGFVKRMEATDSAAIAAFEGYSLDLTQDFTSNKQALYTGIADATYAGGLTPLWRASSEVIALLADEPGDNKVAVVFTDGIDTSSTQSSQDVIDAANQANVRVFMIGLEATANAIDTTEMIDVATGTGGLFEKVTDAQGLDVLFNKALNASKAAGCIDLIFSPVPEAGDTLSGGLEFRIDGGVFNGDYSVSF